jgi:hypothetical protein
VNRLGALRIVDLADLDAVARALTAIHSPCWSFAREGTGIRAAHTPLEHCSAPHSVIHVSHQRAIEVLLQSVDEEGIRYLGPLDGLDAQAVAQVKAVRA